MSNYTIRPALPGDEPLLWEMLYYAANMAADGAVAALAGRDHPFLAPYVAGWGAPGDVGAVAEVADGPFGAAWARRLPGGEHRYAGVPATLPELAIAVRPAWAGRGVGGALLAELIALARAAGHPGLALSVRETNPAQRLYARQGFQLAGEVVNRVGSRSLVMVLLFG